MRELRVEDALLYLDQVKMEFGDRPHIYNEFLDIMKTFKTQQLDTPGVIRRVSHLFQGNRRLVLGFNTFLPEGYKIELPRDGNGPPVAVYRAPGQQDVTHILGPATSASAPASMAHQAPASGPKPPPPAPSHGPMIRQHQAPPGRASMSQPAPMHQGQAGAQPRLSPPIQRPQQHGPPGAAPPPQGAPMDHGGSADPYQRQHAPHSQQQSIQMQQRAQGSPSQQQQQHMIMAADQLPRTNGRLQPQPQAPQEDGRIGPGAPPMQAVQHMAPSQQPPQQPGAPVEFDHAINYVTTIKKRFATEPEIYKKFLEILHTYQKEQRGIKEVLDEVSVLFADHPDLLKEFTYFLPDAVQAQAKAQLDAVAKESEARQRIAAAKEGIRQTAQGMQRQAQVPMSQGSLPGGVIPRASPHAYPGGPTQVPFGATQARSDEREREICRSSIYGSVSFEPVRPPRRSELTPSQAAIKKGRPVMIPELPVQPTTAEAAFFERAKLHLHRRELAPDKPTGSVRRHNPYTEFLKCLHLFGAGIVNREELILLLRGLFMQGHAPKSGVNAGGGASNPAVANDAQELLREFEEIMIGRGPYADQENALKDKSKYGCLSRRDIDFSHSENPTPSYLTIPSDYPQSLFFSHAGQTEVDAAVLNNSLVCVIPQRSAKQRYMISPEEYDGVKARRNVHEEAMFRVEDERYEVDMAIERNVMAMRQIEPMAEEVTRLRDGEENEGQPIGRMTYRLRSRTLNGSQINAVARLYGDKGDEVVQHLMRNPVAVLPLVYRRLRQKDAEWRRIKSELAKEWNAVLEANYEGSLDVLCSSFKKELERIVSPERLQEDCKRTRHLAKHPRKKASLAAISWANPEYFVTCPLKKEVLYSPYARVPMSETGFPHKDVFQLVCCRNLNGVIKSAADRERVARIWAEFVAPWFGYPSYFILPELRESYRGDDNTCTVKFAPGQTVQTAYGEGVIQSKIAAGQSVGMRYKVKLGYGIGYLSPSCIIHLLPAAESRKRMVRRNGDMEPASLLEESEEGVDKRCKMLFGTERIYTFVRTYCFLAFVLANTQAFLKESTKDGKEEVKPVNSLDIGKEKTEEPSEGFTQDYPGLISSLKKLISGDIDIQAFESFCRKATKDRVYQLVALPKLIDRCAETLLKVAKEDKILPLFDLSQLKIMDPERLRVLSFSETTDASYRLQFDPIEEHHYFCYLEPGERVMLEPEEVTSRAAVPMETMEEEDVEEDEEEDVAMDEDGDAEDEVDDGADDGDKPSAKRPKLK